MDGRWCGLTYLSYRRESDMVIGLTHSTTTNMGFSRITTALGFGRGKNFENSKTLKVQEP